MNDYTELDDVKVMTECGEVTVALAQWTWDGEMTYTGSIIDKPGFVAHAYSVSEVIEDLKKSIQVDEDFNLLEVRKAIFSGSGDIALAKKYIERLERRLEAMKNLI